MSDVPQKTISMWTTTSIKFTINIIFLIAVEVRNWCHGASYFVSSLHLIAPWHTKCGNCFNCNLEEFISKFSFHKMSVDCACTNEKWCARQYAVYIAQNSRLKSRGAWCTLSQTHNYYIGFKQRSITSTSHAYIELSVLIMKKKIEKQHQQVLSLANKTTRQSHNAN